MAEKVKLSKDGSSIEFVQTDQIPATLKKFRQSKEIEGFYRFIFENDLQKEAYEVLEKLDLLNILSTYGKPEIVGSLATGLMTWRDIDLEVVDKIDEDKYWDVVKKIFAEKPANGKAELTQ